MAKKFSSLLTNVEIKGASVNDVNSHDLTTVQTRLNGIDQRFRLRDVWALYQKLHFPALEKQTKDTFIKYANNFFSDLMGLKMQTIMPEVLDAFMEKQVKQAKKVGNTRRNSFKNDLKCLKTLLNWYRENYDGMFVVPVLKRHFILGIIRRVPKRNIEKMSLEDVRLFLDAFESSFWRDFAELHFFMAGRVQEAGGLQWSSVDFQRKLITVRDVSIWGEKKKFTYLKEIPKNGEQRIVCLNEQMFNILQRRRQNRSNIPCEFLRQSTGERLNFVFEIKGQPVSYRSAQHQYNIALKKAGLYPKFRSTHILRKAMANIVRQGLGLEAAKQQVAGNLEALWRGFTPMLPVIGAKELWTM